MGKTRTARHRNGYTSTIKNRPEVDYDFKVNVEIDNRSGRMMAVYFKIREGKSAEIRAFQGGKAWADYDRKGRLLGLELLGTCPKSIVKHLGAPPEVRQFILRVAPRDSLTDK